MFRSQDAKIESRPSCLRKAYPITNQEKYFMSFLIPFWGPPGVRGAPYACSKGGSYLIHRRASVITPAYPGRWKKGQNDGNPCAYSEKPTSHRKFLGFPIFYRDFLYFLIFCYIFLGFPINGHPHMFLYCFNSVPP